MRDRMANWLVVLVTVLVLLTTVIVALLQSGAG